MKSKELSGQAECSSHQSHGKSKQPQLEGSNFGENRDLGLKRFEEEINRSVFYWEVFSEEGQQLYEILLGEQGDRNLLSQYAEKIGLDLNAALDELRRLGVLDESYPEEYKLK
jgi:hypothetical protein